MNKVILLIPHFNNIKGLLKSIVSIGKDEKLDVLIVDDGSSVKLDEKIIKKSFRAKGKVFFEFLNVNKGIENALNRGLEIIIHKKYTFTARLDCGDVCVTDRFQKQQLFLEENKDICLVGSNVCFVDTKGRFLYNLKLPRRDIIIRKKMYINAMHIHPTIMFKNQILNVIGLYPTKYKAAEDYAFFFKILNKYKVANINEILVTCEMNSKGISSIQRKQQAKNRIKIILDNFYVGFYPIYGLLRSMLLYIMPLKLLTRLKGILKK